MRDSYLYLTSRVLTIVETSVCLIGEVQNEIDLFREICHAAAHGERVCVCVLFFIFER